MPRKAAPWYRTLKGRPTGRWYVKHNGKQTPLPVTDPNDEGAAWEAFRALVGKAMRDGQPLRAEPFAALIPDYLDSISHRTNAHTRRCYACYLRHFATVHGESCTASIDPVIVEKGAQAEGWSDSNRANYLWAVQAFVRWCGRKEFSLHRPAKESRGAEAVISDEVHRMVLRETTGDFHELCRLLWATGCRPMEAARLNAEDIDWTAGTVSLKRHKMKHKGKQRIIYLSAEALAILRGQQERHPAGPLFRGQGGTPFSVHAVVCRMLRVSEKIGRSVTAYGYRHSYATRALVAGIPDTHVAALLGQSSTRMLHAHYSHLTANAKMLRDVANKVA